MIEVQTGNRTIVICHADYPGDHYAYGKPVNEEAVLWDRDRIAASDHGEIKNISGADQFIFGHTPVPVPQIFANQR